MNDQVNEYEIWYVEKKKGRTYFSKVEWDTNSNFWVYKEENPVNYILAPIK